MGWEYNRTEITVMVGRHNAPSDKRDDRLWSELKERLDEVINDPKYQPINPMRL